MACCAFALFIVGQLLAAFDGVRRLVPFGLLGRPRLLAEPNPAAAWQLGMATVAAEPAHERFGRLGRGLAIAALFELVLLGAFLLLGSHDATAHLPDAAWCRRILP
ncbi:MAG TPA: hypothetical protein VMR50_19790 [Myxococcota bacterium]|nr:hypothetical protein [Myxococcota bacterium]